MVIEIVASFVFVELAKALIWNERNYNQKKEKLDLFGRHLNNSKTWGDLSKVLEEQHRNRPDLYVPIPKPIVIKIFDKLDERR